MNTPAVGGAATNIGVPAEGPGHVDEARLLGQDIDQGPLIVHYRDGDDRGAGISEREISGFDGLETKRDD